MRTGLEKTTHQMGFFARVNDKTSYDKKRNGKPTKKEECKECPEWYIFFSFPSFFLSF